MVPAAELDALYENTLKPRLAALEGLRLEVRRYVTKAGLLIGIPAVLLWAHDFLALAMPDGLGWIALAVPFVALFAGVAVAGFKYLLPGMAAFANYRVRYKHEVAAEVFKMVCPTASYAPLEGITREIFDEPGLFNTRGGYTSDDRVRGVIGKTPFEAADVSRSYSTGGKNSTTVVVFRGLFFHLDFNKRLHGTTVVDPKRASTSSRGDRSALTEVPLENAVFAEHFTVHSDDEVEARYILTPAMMERILTLQARTDRPVHLAFKHNRAYLGVHYGRQLFEPAIRESTSIDAIREMAAHFALAEGIVAELDLNTRIWTKDVDDSLLHTPDTEGVDTVYELASKGDLTPEKLWDYAKQFSDTETSKEDAADEKEPAPVDSWIQIDRGPATVAVHYGLGTGFLIPLVLWAVAVALALAAARLLPDAFEMPALRPFTAWIPEIPVASSLVTKVTPIAWFIGACMLGPFLFLMWAFRVRRVEVAADAVRIWRGLRPRPRRYARPLYGKVVRVENAVYVGKTEGLSLVNASASPMLTVEEARWVATEMRRAIRATTR